MIDELGFMIFFELGEEVPAVVEVNVGSFQLEVFRRVAASEGFLRGAAALVIVEVSDFGFVYGLGSGENGTVLSDCSIVFSMLDFNKSLPGR